MVDSPASQGRPAKKMKLVGRDFVGKIPEVFLDGENNIVKMEFHIHDFANRKEKRGVQFYTGSIKAHGYLWKLWINPRGDAKSNVNVEYTSLFLVYDGKNTETNPVVAKGRMWTKTINREITKFGYSKGAKESLGWPDFGKRKDMIENDCNEAGTLTVTVELQVATEKRSVWYPRLTSCDHTQLYNCTETSDITFIIGVSKKEFYGHKCIFFHRARVWYDLVLTESSSSSSSENNNCIVVLADIDEKVFEVILRFVYTSEVPKLNALDEETIKSILLTANRFGVTELKLYAESVVVEKFLVPSNAANLLLLADSHNCALLKEGTMDTYMTDPQAVVASHIDWTKLQESNKLLSELLLYTSSGGAGERKRYSIYVRNVDSKGDNILEDFDDLDVTSLRERLQQVAKIDVDGSRSMLVERWKDYLMNT